MFYTSQYQYKVKVFTPVKRKKAITKQLHDFKGKFESISQLKAQLTTELRDELPRNESLDVGYFDGRQSLKMWLVSAKDLEGMYEKAKNSCEIFLWVQTCEDTDDDSDDAEPSRKKRKQSKEAKFEEIYSKLKSQQEGSTYTVPQLKLWARMIDCGTHEDYKDPPNVPMITGTPQRRQKESFSEVLAGAAETIIKAFSTPQNPPATLNLKSTPGATGISPGKCTDLRSKNLQQLRVLQELYEDKILSDSELAEQKAIVLDALRSLT